MRELKSIGVGHVGRHRKTSTYQLAIRAGSHSGAEPLAQLQAPVGAARKNRVSAASGGCADRRSAAQRLLRKSLCMARLGIAIDSACSGGGSLGVLLQGHTMNDKAKAEIDALWKCINGDDKEEPGQIMAPACSFTVHGPVLSIVTNHPVDVAALWDRACQHSQRPPA